MTVIKPGFLVLFLVLGLSTIAQIHFEKGYFIDNYGHRIDCFIRNADWKDNPGSIQYRLEEDSEVLKAEKEYMKAFGIGEEVLYERHQVKIDRSSGELNYLEASKEPEFSEETLMLKVLVAGKASLFIFRDGNIVRYFYSVNSQEVAQLVYKRYLSYESQIFENKYYITQLWEDLAYDGLSVLQVNKVLYKLDDFRSFFIKYHVDQGLDYTQYGLKSRSKAVIHLNVRPGINHTSLSIVDPYLSHEEIEFNSAVSGSIGLEFESVLSFNRNKWALFIEPTFHTCKQKAVDDQSEFVRKSIEFPAGIRHYFFLSDLSKVFVNAGVAYEHDFETSKVRLDNGPDLIVSSRIHMHFGLGFKVLDKLSIELRYRTRQDIVRQYVNLSSSNYRQSFIIGYSLF